MKNGFINKKKVKKFLKIIKNNNNKINKNLNQQRKFQIEFNGLIINKLKFFYFQG